MELIGSGVSCRAVLRKGSLALVTRVTAGGHVAYIVDEERQVCKSAGETMMHFEGDTFKADPRSGAIHIPFVPSSRSGPAVISHKGFAALTDFQQLELHYELDAVFVIHDEALIVGNRAKLLVRPSLQLNGMCADLRLLKKVGIAVQTYSDGVPHTKNYDGLEVKDGELVIEMQVPPKLERLKFKLTAEVSTGSRH